MKRLVLKRRGDTLVEVSLAIGIFSLVAISVVSVVGTSTSSAQAALETTVTREELDAQAEALRFIHTSYINSGDNSNNRYKEIWEKITGKAVNAMGIFDSNVTIYRPANCADLYGTDKMIYNQNGFVINTRKLGNGGADEIVWDYRGNQSTFAPAATYPRIIYQDSNAMYYDDSTNDITRVEGVYIMAVKDPGTTKIVSGGGASRKSAYYDFYIRSCWYGPGADRPSTISTVIRLQDPAAVEY